MSETRQDWRTMPEGNALDVLVAVRVMGWGWATDPASPGAYLLSPKWCQAIRDGAGYDYMRPGIRLGDDGKPHDPRPLIPGYSSDILAAWEVVEAMHALGWYARLETPRSPLPPSTHRARMIRHNESGWSGNYAGVAETMPLAICRAALAAVMEVPELA